MNKFEIIRSTRELGGVLVEFRSGWLSEISFVELLPRLNNNRPGFSKVSCNVSFDPNGARCRAQLRQTSKVNIVITGRGLKLTFLQIY